MDISPATVLLLLAAAAATFPGALTQPSQAMAPAPPGPTNVTKILEKAGQFTVFIRLLKATGVASQLYGQLNNSDNGITIFAPSDSAFSALKSGTLNSLTDEQQTELVQFHVIPTFISSSNFQTVSNPLRTQAGDSADGHFPLNVTTNGSSVNLTSGLTNTSVSGNVYSDAQLAIYQIDQVLRPQQVFDPRPPAPSPAPSVVKSKKKSHANSPDDDSPADASLAPPVVGPVRETLSFCFFIASLVWFYL
ncbi:PREDICTED: fasciclin-like arabinogalactan protein 12 [Tarenaya hassleriana]|uniref:fasciclin-like arabinogalactan protein 12 n=1 Tax=Tarenaya hassleriana TaxID=28532 RepID=UPI00053C55C4|nr:PREDICTED: fasciclin-like arabinogalactan protein 12 [Tarenaya hassleriana]